VNICLRIFQILYSEIKLGKFFMSGFWIMAFNRLVLQEVGDFGALNCLPPRNLMLSMTCSDSSGKLHLSKETANFLWVLLKSVPL